MRQGTGAPGLPRLFILFVIAALALAGAPVTSAAQDLVCDRGDLELRKLAFEGNEAFSDSHLAQALATTASDWMRRTTGFWGARRCLDPAELPRDSLRLLVFYRRHGYYDASVSYEVRPAGTRAAAVHFRVAEGRPVLLDSLTVTGLDSVPSSLDVLRNLPLREGEPFDRGKLAASRDTIERRLLNAGYPGARVAPEYAIDYESSRATAGFTVDPGPRARVGAIRVNVTPVAGREQEVSDRRVTELLRLRVGEYYSERERIEAQRSLYQTELYQHVELRLARDSTGPDSLVTVEVNLRELKPRWARAGLGWGTLDCFRAQGQVIDYNFLKDARRLELTGRLSKIGTGVPLDGAEALCTGAVEEDPFSDTLNYSISTTFRQPMLFGFRNPPSITLYSSRISEYKAYLRTVPIGGIASLTREAQPNLPLTLSYELAYGRTVAQPALFCAVFLICTSRDRRQLEDDQRHAVASVALERNRTDRPGSPTRGSISRLELRHSSPAIFSDLGFNKIVGDIAWYRRAGGSNVLAARLRVGGVLGNRISLEGLSDRDFVPQQERLYAGGPTTVRGFRQNELGPTVYVVDMMDTTRAAGDTVYYGLPEGQEVSERAVPTGGNTLVVGNLEYRIQSPILRDYVQLTAFTDVGEVWNRGREGLSFNQLKWTPGVGVRVFTPVGALRVDMGYNFYDRPRGPAYYTVPPTDERNLAPVYCVSPGNRLPVTEDPVDPSRPPVQAVGCPATFLPRQRLGWQRATFNFSIGQAF